MGGERDLVRELGGHCIAVQGDVSDVARRQPEFDGQRREQESGE
jgi:hypothetical protein